MKTILGFIACLVCFPLINLILTPICALFCYPPIAFAILIMFVIGMTQMAVEDKKRKEEIDKKDRGGY